MRQLEAFDCGLRFADLYECSLYLNEKYYLKFSGIIIKIYYNPVSSIILYDETSSPRADDYIIDANYPIETYR